MHERFFAISAKPPVPIQDAARRLTPRQCDVLELHIARETVRNHVRGVLAELRLHSRVEAIAAGLLDD